MAAFTPDALDFAILRTLDAEPRIGVLELSRRLHVARPTVQARISRMETSGVISGYQPHIDLAAAGFNVHAFVTLEITQGALDSVQEELEAMPGVIEAYATTGDGDVLCRIAASSHTQLQQVLVDLNRCSVVARSTSVVVLSDVIRHRTLPLLFTVEPTHNTKAPAFRE